MLFWFIWSLIILPEVTSSSDFKLPLNSLLTCDTNPNKMYYYHLTANQTWSDGHGHGNFHDDDDDYGE